MDRYKKIEKTNPDATLGEGAYGVVYKAIDLQTNKHVALKKIRVEIEDEGIPTTALREIVLLRQLEHPNVVKLENVVMDAARLYLVFELVDTDLKKYMDSVKGALSADLVQSYASQILEGLAYCHSMGVMHRDLKPQNILVAHDGGLKIADFGLARAFTPQHRPLTIEVITRWYRAPEILLGSNIYSSSVDLWSVGCIVAEMSNKRAFLPGDSEIDQLHKIFQVLGTPNNDSWPGVENHPYWRNNYPCWNGRPWDSVVPILGSEGTDFLSKIFEYIPDRRITAEEALLHPFITRQYQGESDSLMPVHTLLSDYPVDNNARGFLNNDITNMPDLPPAHVEASVPHIEESNQGRELHRYETQTNEQDPNQSRINRVTPDDMTTNYNEENKNNDDSNIDGLITEGNDKEFNTIEINQQQSGTEKQQVGNDKQQFGTKKTGLPLLTSENNTTCGTDVQNLVKSTDIRVADNADLTIETNNKKNKKATGVKNKDKHNGDIMFENPPKRVKRGANIPININTGGQNEAADENIYT
eukprot:CAMPEP_0119051274 /NCGR_PEP_ID=MMETSP1177-20130426/72941_1 /TAXON_ID=2985 /ORGANISM="Ochromonas sp, Strain CCMP1899" /LENGTH=528 /DNA_ID=CAMNT_0007030417 /DNA_START=146 /DNA_END=1732 /DNA_ORIENTATION=-